MNARFPSSRRQVLVGCSVLALVAAGAAYWIRTTRADYFLQQGRAALARGDQDAAERLAKRLEQCGEQHHEHLLRGEFWIRRARAAWELLEALPSQDPRRADQERTAQNAFRHALKELTQIEDEGPLTIEGTVLAAECLVHLGDHALAAEALSRIVAQQPDRLDAHRWLAAIYIDLNSPSQAIEHLRAWARLDPTNGRPYRWIAWFCKDYDRSAEAVAAYREACQRQLTPEAYSAVLRELAETLLEAQADYEAAWRALASCPEPLDHSPEILALRAECLWGLGRQSEAARLAEEALQAAPNLARALLLRAQIHLTQERPQAALPLLERAVAQDPFDHRGRLYLMQAYQRLGDRIRAEEQRRLLEEAKGYKERLTQLHQEAVAHPWDDRVRYQIGTLCVKLQRPQEAEMWLRAALACNPDNQEARRELAQLTGQGSVGALPGAESRP